MNIGPEIASKKFAIFLWARRALSSGWRAKVCQEQVTKGLTKHLPSSRSRGTTARQANDERSPNAQMTIEHARTSSVIRVSLAAPSLRKGGSFPRH